MIFAHLIQAASNSPTDVSALESSISALERAILALESDVKALESRSVPWEYSVWVFTFLVVVGVALELWVIRHDWRDEMEAWALAHFGVIRLPGRPSLLKLRVEIASVLLITLGVTGELVIGIKIASISSQLRGKSAELRSKNAELRTKSDQLVALLGQQTAQLERSNLELKDLIQPRELTAKEQAQLKGELKHFSGRVISLRSYSLDTEAKRFGKLLKPIFEGEGLRVSDNLGNLMNLGGNVVEGIQIAGPHSQDDLIQALLNSPLTLDHKLRMFRKDDPRIAPDALVEILIGVKPIVVQPQ